jgi:hypothetical protein
VIISPSLSLYLCFPSPSAPTHRLQVHELLLEGSMQRNAAYVTQTLSSSGASVMRFEVQKIVKGGSKARLLILNVDVKVLIQVRS